MKKVLYFALVALLALPLMFSCKPKDEPEAQKYDPENPEEGIGSNEWFDYWTEGEDSAKVEIDIKNLTGFWQLRAEGSKSQDPNDPDLILKPGFIYDLAVREEQYFYYYELKEDMTDTLFMMTNRLWGEAAGVATLDKYPGTWQVIGQKLTINRQVFPNGFDVTPAAAKSEFSIYLLEKDRMVWRYNDNCYAVFVRAEKPKEPKNRSLTEVLTSKKWNIAYDHQLTTGFKASNDPHDASGGTTDTLETKKNMWHNYKLEFKAEGGDSTLIVYDAAGNKFEEFSWSVYGGDDIIYLSFHFDGCDENKLFSEYISLEWMDFKDYNKARMWSWEQVTPPANRDAADMQRWFEIEGVK